MSAQRKSIAVLASGRGSNLQALIDAAHANEINAHISVVISDKEESMALARAQKAGIAAVFVSRKEAGDIGSFERQIDRILEEHSVDLICLAGFMRLLSPEFVQKHEGRIINIHPALLPSFPGLRAQKQALSHGVKISGCTVHFVDQGMDSGPIICQRAVEVSDSDTEETLSARILSKEHEAYVEAVRLFCDDRLSIVGRRVFIEQTRQGE